MRPASEIHSALDLLRAEIERQGGVPPVNMLVAHDVLAWVVGERLAWDGPTDWLCAFLLPDPPRIDDTPTEVN